MGDQIPEDNVNGYTYGIRSESQGSSADIKMIPVPGDSFTTARSRSDGTLFHSLPLVGKRPGSPHRPKGWAAANKGKPDLVNVTLWKFPVPEPQKKLCSQVVPLQPLLHLVTGIVQVRCRADRGFCRLPATVPVGSIK